MNNLTQKQKDAKADCLQRQLEQIIQTHKAALNTERRAAIKHIDSFLETLPVEGQLFWLKLRQKLKRMNEGFSMRPDAFQTIYCGGNSIFPQ